LVFLGQLGAHRCQFRSHLFDFAGKPHPILINLRFKATDVLFECLNAFVQRFPRTLSNRCPHRSSDRNGARSLCSVHYRPTQKSSQPQPQALEELWLAEFATLNPGQLICDQRKARDLKHASGDGWSSTAHVRDVSEGDGTGAPKRPVPSGHGSSHQAHQF